MNVLFDDDGLRVGKYYCHDVTVTVKDGVFYFNLYKIKDVTKCVEVIDKWGEKKTKLTKLTLHLKSKTFNYVGVPLTRGYWHRDDVVYFHAKNDKGNYINYYEPKKE